MRIEKPDPPMPPDFRDREWWACMASWLDDERPMSDRCRAEAFARCRGLSDPFQGVLL